jgi:hypothetical protein
MERVNERSPAPAGQLRVVAEGGPITVKARVARPCKRSSEALQAPVPAGRSQASLEQPERGDRQRRRAAPRPARTTEQRGGHGTGPRPETSAATAALEPQRRPAWAHHADVDIGRGRRSLTLSLRPVQLRSNGILASACRGSLVVGDFQYDTGYMGAHAVSACLRRCISESGNLLDCRKHSTLLDCMATIQYSETNLPVPMTCILCALNSAFFKTDDKPKYVLKTAKWIASCFSFRP